MMMTIEVFVDKKIVNILSKELTQSDYSGHDLKAQVSDVCLKSVLASTILSALINREYKYTNLLNK